MLLEYPAWGGAKYEEVSSPGWTPAGRLKPNPLPTLPRRATSTSETDLIGTPRTWTRPSSISRSAGAASRRNPASDRIRSRRTRPAWSTAGPALAMTRLAKLPEPDADGVSGDLGERGLVALTLGRGALRDHHPPPGVQAHDRALERAESDALDAQRDPDPAVPTSRSQRPLFRARPPVIDLLERPAQEFGIVSAVIHLSRRVPEDEAH